MSGQSDDQDEEGAPGWDAIDAVFARLYPGETPRHAAYVLPFLGGDDPLQGISAYEGAGPPPHWHFVSYGFSDLYAKQGDDPQRSGYGFELTFRLARGPEDNPPSWAFNFLQNLARYVFRTGNTFSPGEQMNLNGPIALEEETAIRAIIFVEDPQAGSIETPNGAVQFIQVVGVTEDELDAAQTWNTQGLARLLQQASPLLVTDLARTSLVATPEGRTTIVEGLAAEGSSCGLLYVEKAEGEARGEGLHVTLGAQAVTGLLRVLPHRLPFGRSLVLAGRDGFVSFEPGAASRAELSDGQAVVTLDAPAGEELLATLKPVAGEYVFARCPSLTLTVVRSEILDRNGAVIDTIG